MLKSIYLTFWKIVVERVAVVKFRVNNGCGNGASSLEVKKGTTAAEFTNMVVARFRNS